MPILPENKALYPKNWKEISKYIRTKRAKNKCEVCGTPNYAIGYRQSDGKFMPACGAVALNLAGSGLNYPSLEPFTAKQANEFCREMNDARTDSLDPKWIVIILTVAHLDHNPANCDHNNLKAMCQRCHNVYDRQHRNETRANKKSQTKLF